MKQKALLLVTVLAIAMFASVSSAIASTPWPDNGRVNLVTKTITLEYAQAPYSRPVLSRDLNGRYADVWIAGARERVSTTARANAVLTTPRTRNSSARLVIPHRSVDLSGKISVRHGLALNKPQRGRQSMVATGLVRPGKGHQVSVKLQRRYFGVWVTRQAQTVATKDTGKFTAVFTAQRYTGTYRVRASVSADRINAGKVAYAPCQ